MRDYMCSADIKQGSGERIQMLIQDLNYALPVGFQNIVSATLRTPKTFSSFVLVVWRRDGGSEIKLLLSSAAKNAYNRSTSSIA